MIIKYILHRVLVPFNENDNFFIHLFICLFIFLGHGSHLAVASLPVSTQKRQEASLQANFTNERNKSRSHHSLISLPATDVVLQISSNSV